MNQKTPINAWRTEVHGDAFPNSVWKCACPGNSVAMICERMEGTDKLFVCPLCIPL